MATFLLFSVVVKAKWLDTRIFLKTVPLLWMCPRVPQNTPWKTTYGPWGHTLQPLIYQVSIIYIHLSTTCTGYLSRLTYILILFFLFNTGCLYLKYLLTRDFCTAHSLCSYLKILLRVDTKWLEWIMSVNVMDCILFTSLDKISHQSFAGSV